MASDPAWAWAPFEPDAQHPWTLRSAAHLLRRAGLGPSWPELQQALADGPQRTVDKLLQPEADVAAFNRDRTTSRPPTATRIPPRGCAPGGCGGCCKPRSRCWRS